MRAFFLPLLLAVAPLTASALEVPKFNKGGFLITLQAGAGVPHLDESYPTSDLTSAAIALAYPLYRNNVPKESVGLGLRLAYNILGFVSIGADATATGWSVFDSKRGGTGFLVGLVAIHPMQFFFLQKDERPFGLDFSTHVGVGYGISGTSDPALGYDGIAVQWGLTLDYFVNRYIGFEFFAKCNFLQFDKFYTDWDGAHQGGFGAATRASRGGGTWWHTGLALVLRIGD